MMPCAKCGRFEGRQHECGVTRKIDWPTVQALYDTGLTTNALQRQTGIGWRYIVEAKRAGLFATRPWTRSPGYIPKHVKRVGPRVAWNKGLTNADPRVLAISEKVSVTLKRQYAAGDRHAPSLDEKQRAALSLRQSLKNSGGRCRWYVVDGRKVQGTWERDFAERLLLEHVEWKRPNKVWLYSVGGIVRRYTPDFYIPTADLFVEIKGFWWGNDRAKMVAVAECNRARRLVLLTPDRYAKVMTSASAIAALLEEPLYFPDVAPMVERCVEDARVTGSSPVVGTI